MWSYPMLFEAKLGGYSAIISDHEDSCVAKNIQHDIDRGKFDFKEYNERVAFLDIGSCLGMVSMHVSRRSRSTSIIAIEPHPENYKHMLMNLHDNSEYALTLPFAIGPEFGRSVIVRNNSNTGGATMNSKFCSKSDDHHPQSTVVVVPLNFIFEEYVPEHENAIVKMDIEGSEHTAFDTFKYWNRIVCLHLECHMNDNLRNKGYSSDRLLDFVTSKFSGELHFSTIEMGE